MAHEVLTAVTHTPVLAGVCGVVRARMTPGGVVRVVVGVVPVRRVVGLRVLRDCSSA